MKIKTLLLKLTVLTVAFGALQSFAAPKPAQF